MQATISVHDKNFILYLDNKMIQQRVAQIAADINTDFKDKNPVFLIILRGAFMFAADILKNISIPCEIDFVKLSSYDGLQTSGKIKLEAEPKIELKNRNIIIIEDIVDSGLTMAFFLQYLELKRAKSITLVSLLSKPENLQRDIKINYCGFVIPNLFVVGYGLDYNEQGRNLDAIYQIVCN
jgi:hypoxanthine phosphoribosyltransferase